MLQKAVLFIKAGVIGLLFLVLQIPLQMIDGLVKERAGRQREVVQEIASSSFGRQSFAGLVLSVPYVEEYEERITEEKKTRIEKRRVERVARFFPATSEIDGRSAVETKSRGLFKARVFNWRASVKGEFVLDGKFAWERSQPGSRITRGTPFVSLALGDPRGLAATTALQWEGAPAALERGTGLPRLESGVHAEVPDLDPMRPQRRDYALAIGLQGTESLAVVPLAGVTRVRLASDWPHPSFGGQFLPQPETQRGGRSGFEAGWNVSALASGAQQQLLAAIDGTRDCRQGACADRLEVRFIEPIDIYSLSDRALKYGFLFIGLTFGAFLVFEILKTLRIHPAQYFLVGTALATFFLLLLGLSEHVAFWIAYAIASAACIALLGFYLGAALRSPWRGLSFSTLLTGLYGALYGLLVSEDNSLLLGALLVFALVALVLVLTRKLDWYALGAAQPAAG